MAFFSCQHPCSTSIRNHELISFTFLLRGIFSFYQGPVAIRILMETTLRQAPDFQILEIVLMERHLDAL